MKDYIIHILNDDQIETPISIFDINLTYQLWNTSMTPWEHRRIFKIFGLNYNFGNKHLSYSDSYLNYQLIENTVHQFKQLKKANQCLNLAKIISHPTYELCDDIVSKIIHQFQ